MRSTRHSPRWGRRCLAPTAAALAALLAGALGTPALAGPATGAGAAAEEYERVINGTFDNGETSPWWGGDNVALRVENGALCADVTGGTANPWNALFGQNRVPLEQDAQYTYSFEAWASSAHSIHTTVQLATEPYTTALNETVSLGTSSRSYSYTFTSELATEDGQVTFQLGGTAEDYTVCVDNVSLVGGTTPPGGSDGDTGPAVRVNQVGYLPEGPKGATLVTDATGPVPWELHASDGSVVASGQTTVHGDDAASGQHVHEIDFSDYTQPGSGYTVVAGGAESYPFTISTGIYDQLRHDALTFYYHQRSGTPIEAEYVGENWARPAGHVGKAPNKGDISVPCHPDLSCDYELDVSGGWYDAGDHGKYVVNGGISVWQLLNEYERTVHVEGADAAALTDGSLPLPEAGNGVPDILDEARWELEFLLSMQVPEGEPLAGMAHHKVHDDGWSGLPMPPHEDPRARYLHSPSTAATLNLAAAAAQCARIYDSYDPAFADKCRTAAERAWQAAQEHPRDYAPPPGGNHSGGGAYGDDDVTDEFYWAAAELFVTTGDGAYLQALTSNQHAGADVFTAGGFSWGYTAPLARLSLAVVPNELPDDRLASVRESIVTAADGYVQDLRSQGYPVPYEPANGEYVWGSNSQVLNNAVVVAYAYDLTGEAKYREAALRSMSYILGRNALNQSYVTGYGERTSHRQHHRFWAHSVDSSLPEPPPGAMAGGPNSGLNDPVAQRELQGCAPQACYIDHIESYSTNEVTINWNASLAWMTAFAADTP